MTEMLLFIVSMVLVFFMALALTSGWNIVIVIWLSIAFGFTFIFMLKELAGWEHD
jgi:fatty acid desaturase